jgi:large subunit ribosomal protein L10
VAKKTLLSVAFKQAGVNVNPRELDGNIGVAFGYDDSIGAMKLMGDFAKKYEALKIIGGVFEGKFIGAAEAIALSKLPSKQELLGQLVGQLQAPISAFVRVLNAVAQRSNS